MAWESASSTAKERFVRGVSDVPGTEILEGAKENGKLGIAGASMKGSCMKSTLTDMPDMPSDVIESGWRAQLRDAAWESSRRRLCERGEGGEESIGALAARYLREM
jgi:hypothetical protein